MKRYLAQAMRGVSFHTGWALRQALAIKKPRILMYHAVAPHDVDAQAFTWQLRWLKKHFEPMALLPLLERLAQGRCHGLEVAITFDDGVRNHLTAAYPALQAEKVPATFFVCPGLADSGQWIWNMALRARLKTLSGRERASLAQTQRWPSCDIEPLIAWAKTLALPVRCELESLVVQHTQQFVPTRGQDDLFTPMSWAQLQSLDPALITIGSHTVNHPILTTLDRAAQDHEISHSRVWLEQQLQRPVPLFCYPNGGNDPSVVELTRRHYQYAVTTEENFIEPGGDAHRLARVPACGQAALFARRLARPGS
jgi:peptidoglycan/xylan/chitin deacetylase (PgdA/CDA1 family)